MFEPARLLFGKEIRLFRRSPHIVMMLLGFSLLLSAVSSVALRSVGMSSAESLRVFAGSLWLVFLFSGISLLQFAWNAETEDGAFRGIVPLAGGDGAFFAAKILATTAALFFLECAGAFILGIFHSIPFAPVASQLALLFLLAAFGFASLGTLLAGIAAGGTDRALLFPLVFYPLLIPFLWALVSETLSVLVEGTLHASELSFLFLVVFDVISAALVMILGGEITAD